MFITWLHVRRWRRWGGWSYRYICENTGCFLGDLLSVSCHVSGDMKQIYLTWSPGHFQPCLWRPKPVFLAKAWCIHNPNQEVFVPNWSICKAFTKVKFEFQPKERYSFKGALFTHISLSYGPYVSISLSCLYRSVKLFYVDALWISLWLVNVTLISTATTQCPHSTQLTIESNSSWQHITAVVLQKHTLSTFILPIWLQTSRLVQWYC